MSDKIFISINKSIINKIEGKGSPLWPLFLNDFKNFELTVHEVADCINEGYAVCAQHNSPKESKNFIRANMLFIDVDNGLNIETALSHPFVQMHASIFHTTQSHTDKHHRFRLAFRLERVITDKAEMRHALVGLTRKFNCDKSCVDPCRGFFGSKGSNPVDLGGFITNAVLDELIKSGSEKIVVTREKENDSEPDTSSLYVQSLDDNQLVTNKNGQAVELTSLPKLTSIYCPMHIDRNPSAFIVISAANVHGVHCRACATTFWPKSRKRKFYDFASFERYILMDKYSSQQSGWPQYEKLPEYEAITTRIKTCTVLDEKYLPKNIPLQKGITYMKSPKGSGKTEWLAEIVKHCRDTNQSVLLIGHRQSLIQGISKRLDLTCYFYVEGGKVKNDIPDRYYAVCVDSIHKLLNPGINKYDVVIIDESEQVFSHLIGNTIKDKRRITYEIFFFYLRLAKSVVFADADLDLITVSTATDVVLKEKDIHIYLNTFKNTQSELKSYADESHLLHDLLESIANGGRYYVSTNSKRKAKALAVAIEKQFNNQKKVLIVSSDTTDNDEVKELLNDITTAILKYDVVISTPTLGTGVDITFPEKKSLIDGVYGFYISRVNTHFDMDQQLARVRHPKFVKVYISPENFNFETDVNVISYETQCNSQLNDMLNGYCDDGVPKIEKKYLNLYARVNAMSRGSKNRLKTNFINYKKENGFDVVEVERPSKEDLKVMRRYMRDCKDEVDLVRNTNIANAKDIDYEKYNFLRKEEDSGNISNEDELSLRKREIQEFYKQAVSLDLVVLDDSKKYRDKLRLLETYLTPLANLQAKGRIEINERLYYSDKENLSLTKISIYELLFSAGLAKNAVAFDLGAQINNGMLRDFTSVCRSKSTTIQKLFDINVTPKDLNKKPMNTLNRILNLVGLRIIKCDRRRVGGKSTNFYRIDESSYAQAMDIIKRRIKDFSGYTWTYHKKQNKSFVGWRKSEILKGEGLCEFEAPPLNKLEERIDKWSVDDFNAQEEILGAVNKALQRRPKKVLLGF